jgi:hypothetical protein
MRPNLRICVHVQFYVDSQIQSRRQFYDSVSEFSMIGSSCTEWQSDISFNLARRDSEAALNDMWLVFILKHYSGYLKISLGVLFVKPSIPGAMTLVPLQSGRLCEISFVLRSVRYSALLPDQINGKAQNISVFS